MSIGHALPSNLTVNFTVENGTVGGETTGTVTIPSGDTSSNVIKVLPDAGVSTYSLTSNLTKFVAFSGHIASSSIATTRDDTFCQGVGESNDTSLTDNIVTVLGGVDCFDITTTSLQGLTGTLLLNGTDIEAIDPLVTQALIGLDILRLNNNNLAAIPANAFANLENLTELHLNENQIASIAANAFEDLSSLELS